MINISKDVQVIEMGGHPAFAIMTHKKWQKIQELLEDFSDLRAYDEGIAAFKKDKRRTYPADVVYKICDGENPIAVLRKWRGLTQAKLAKKARLNPLTISHIETGVRKGGITALRKIAKALDVSLDMLTP
jgi:DNA-binding XRE family transcriptional regulator